MLSGEATLPKFTYHADPVGTGVIEPSDDMCSCCGAARGFVYIGRIVGDELLPDGFRELCPWCIADGTAAKRLGIRFVESDALTRSDLPERVVEEITCRTPAYSSWQDPEWLCHCDDACVFHGDLTIEEAQDPDWEAISAMLEMTVADAKKAWPEYAEHYVPADPSIFKFVCRHCNKVIYQIDST